MVAVRPLSYHRGQSLGEGVKGPHSPVAFVPLMAGVRLLGRDPYYAQLTESVPMSSTHAGLGRGEADIESTETSEASQQCSP